MPKEVADKMPTTYGDFSLKQWKEVHEFFGDGKVPLKSLEASALSYDQVQVNNYENTIDSQREEIKQVDQQRRDSAYQKSIPG